MWAWARALFLHASWLFPSDRWAKEGQVVLAQAAKPNGGALVLSVTVCLLVAKVRESAPWPLKEEPSSNR